MRIVITGASGNVGTALLRRLSGHGHELLGVCRRPPGDAGPYAGVGWTSLDLAGRGVLDALRPVVRGADAVVHLAWGFQPSRDVNYLDRLGVGGTRAVIEAVQAEGVPHLVHMSSVGAYSPGGQERVAEAWPTEGIDSLPYSREKVAAERLLDDHERRRPDGTAVARMRPGLIVQRDAGSALLRYGVPALLPSALLRHVPVLPLDEDLVVPIVHTDDVADAFARVLDQRATGAFNLAADPPVTRDLIAEVLGARPVHVPKAALRAAADLAWRAGLQPLDPGWIDLAFAIPLMDCTRARTELGWAPTVDARAALTQVVEGMADGASTSSPALRPRTVFAEVSALLRRGNIATRTLP
ncbi:nucleoside-diphosphate-sugar epimerase [Pseudonocardia sediminis]|uniref:Nucleoside-diphosphate-sugar epimerase n=1 Tax=Pseudonocardia sediminis TaxID=1397368 RepID=A0A4Q7UQK5_PSEST|nr:NAD-dependent epimerase/dehydratase family protein [Pseudonocardia sediminis]RZT83836.1 nucleoside-diphosphate-sugar epimerase [Pseudonocardia sediminis]